MNAADLIEAICEGEKFSPLQQKIIVNAKQYKSFAAAIRTKTGELAVHFNEKPDADKFAKEMNAAENKTEVKKARGIFMAVVRTK